jgi:hypothetical protein
LATIWDQLGLADDAGHRVTRLQLDDRLVRRESPRLEPMQIGVAQHLTQQVDLLGPQLGVRIIRLDRRRSGGVDQRSRLLGRCLRGTAASQGRTL